MIKEKIYGNMFYNNKWYSYFKAKYPKGELADYQRTTGEEEVAGPFYMKSSVGGNVGYTRLNDDVPNLMYSFDNTDWTEFTGEDIYLPVNSHLYIKGENSKLGIQFHLPEETSLFGSLVSLTGESEIGDSCFANLFKRCNGLVDASNLIFPDVAPLYCYERIFERCINLIHAPKILPALEVGGIAYGNMFDGCTKLIDVPKILASSISSWGCRFMFANCSSLENVPVNLLSATILEQEAYSYMFQNCTSLKNVPSLPVLTVPGNCYRFMFYGCRSLETVPVDLLPATTVAANSYGNMFDGCTSLRNVPNLPALNISSSSYYEMFKGCTSLETVPVDLLPATNITTACYENMFFGCTSLRNVPNLPSLEVSMNGYRRMFMRCTSLENVPVDLLPATKLNDECYRGMFNGCTNLKNAPILPAIEVPYLGYMEMFYDCTNLHEITCYMTGGRVGWNDKWLNNTSYGIVHISPDSEITDWNLFGNWMTVVDGEEKAQFAGIEFIDDQPNFKIHTDLDELTYLSVMYEKGEYSELIEVVVSVDEEGMIYVPDDIQESGEYYAFLYTMNDEGEYAPYTALKFNVE